MRPEALRTPEAARPKRLFVGMARSSAPFAATRPVDAAASGP